MDCCRLVAGRFGGNCVVYDGGTTSELEVSDNDSRFEVVRCNGRGGNECRLVDVTIFFKPSVEDIPAMANIKWRTSKGDRGLTDWMLMCSRVTNRGSEATRN